MLGQKKDSQVHSYLGSKHNSNVKNVVGEKNVSKVNSGFSSSVMSGTPSTEIFNTSNSSLSWNEPMKGSQNPKPTRQGW